MSLPNLKGTGVALVTPMKADLSIDYDGLKKLLDHIIEGGTEYVVVTGTTGESPTVSWSEKLEMLAFIHEYTSDYPIVFGHGGNNTADLVKKLDELKDFPLTAILSTSPYYNKPSQEGIYRHYCAIADKSPFPVILYNVPGRTSSNVEAETTIRLSTHSNIIGTKEAAGDLNQCKRILEGTDPNAFVLLSGDDALALPMIEIGASGVISVIANLQPKEFSDMVRAGLEGDISCAREMNSKLEPGYSLMLKEGNPVSVKKGLEVAGLIHSDVRLPLWKASEALGDELRRYLKH